MNVLKRNSRMSVLLRMYIVVMLGAFLGLGCPPKRRARVAGPGDAQTPEGTWKGPGGTDPGGDVSGIPRDGGGGMEIGGEEEGPLKNVHFEYDSAALTPEAMNILQSHALWLKDHPGVRVTLEGHCDERGTAEYNMALGEHRARAVYDYLTSLGVPGTRLSTVSFGKERPLELGQNEMAWAKNRRVRFAVSG